MADSPLDSATGPIGIDISLDGAPCPEATRLHALRITRELGRIPTATVSILSGDSEAEDFAELDSSTFVIGTKIKISCRWGAGSAQEVFSGVILSMRLRLNAQVGQMLELTCRDPALKLLEMRTTQQFIKQRDSDVITALISDAGLKAETEATTAKRDQIFAGASKWQSIRLLADRNGLLIDVYDGKVRVFKPDTKAEPKLAVTYGDSMLELDAQINAQRMIGSAGYSGWDIANQDIREGTDDTLTDPTLGNIKAKDIADVLGKRAFSATTGADLEDSVLKDLAKARMMRAGLDAVSGTVTFLGSGKCLPGDMIGIAQSGQRFNGKGFVSGVTHKISDGTWTTTARMGLPLDWVSDIHTLEPPAAAAVATPVPGLQIGQVIQVHGDPEDLERVLVLLPMIGADEVQVWARLGAPYATAAAGIQFLPETDDEVLVGFLNDDPNAPIILGSLHNPKAKRPETAKETNFIKKIVTKEKLAITFDDEKKILTVETPAGNSVILDDDDKKIVLTDSRGSTVTLDEDGIALKSEGDITLDAGGDVKITAVGDATIGAANVTCDADMGFTGKGAASCEVSSGGQTTVKGSMVMIN